MNSERSLLKAKRASHGRGGFSDAASVWLRLSAFLSTRAPNTQVTYKGIIEEWCLFLGAASGTEEAAKRIVSATDLHAIAYRRWLTERPGQKPRAAPSASPPHGKAPSTRRFSSRKKEGLDATQSYATIAKKFSVLRRIYKMLLAAGMPLQHNPFDSDRVPPPPKEAGRKRPTEMIDFAKVKEVIAIVDAATPKGLRDKAVLCALFGGALRRSEVVGLRVGDVRRTPSGTTYVYLRSTKAKRDAEQALPRWAADTVESLAELRREQDGASDGDYLFVGFSGQAGKTSTNRPMSVSAVYQLFKSCCLRAGVGPHVSPHSARATAITRLLAEGIPHREVQEFSRHASIQMVELYDKRRISVDESPGKELEYE